MILAQLCFAAMNVFTRLGSRHVPWPEIAAARFLVGAGIAIGLAATRGVSLRVTDRRGTWRRSIYGTMAALGAFYALSSPSIGVGDAATLGATAPIFVAMLAGPLLGERSTGGFGSPSRWRSRASCCWSGRRSPSPRPSPPWRLRAPSFTPSR
jgi:drug/metabolite transporter (DMT)-like permease